MTRLIPALEQLAIGSKIPTNLHSTHPRGDGVGARHAGSADSVPMIRPAQPNRSRFLLPVMLGLAILGALSVTGLLVKAAIARMARGGPIDTKHAPESRVSAMAATATAADTPSPAGAACSVVGRPKPLAAHAVLASGIELAPTAQGIALGFAARSLQAVTMLVHPTTLSVASNRVSRSSSTIRRVTPVLLAPHLETAISNDRPGDPIATRRTSSGASPIDLGHAGGHLVWAPHESDEVHALWPLAGNAPVEALRAVPLEGSQRGYAIAFRRAGAIWTGIVSANSNDGFSTSGDLSETKGLGPQVGSPSIAVSGDTALVVWADRTGSEDAWGLRYRRWRIAGSGNDPSADAPPTAFEAPAGGWGGPYISPAVTSLGGGRFLLVWTEGPLSAHRVRALDIDAQGHPQGAPLVISGDMENAGQGQAAVMPDGHGMVAYLAASSRGFKVMATSIACP